MNPTKNFINYFGSNVALRAVSILTIPITTIYLTIEDYGQYSLFFSYVSFCSIFLTLNSHSAISRYFYEGRQDFKTFVSTSFWFSVLLVIFLGASTLFFNNYLGLNFIDKPIWVIILIIINVLLMLNSSVFVQIFEPMGNSGLIATRSVVSGLLITIFSVFSAIFAPSPKWIYVILFTGLANVLIAIYFLRDTMPYIVNRFEPKHLKYILSYSIPLLPHALSGIILSQIDRIMIGKIHSVSSVGLYSFAFTITSVFVLITDSINRSWLPKYFEYMNKRDYRQHDTDIKRILNYVVLIAITIMLVFEFPMRILIDKKFYDSFDLVPILIIGFYFDFLFTIYGRNIGYVKRTGFTSALTFSAGLINICLNLFFLPKYGYCAAPINTLVSYVFIFFGAYFVNKLVLKVHGYSLIWLIKPSLIVVFAAIVFYFINYFGGGFYINYFIKLVILAVLVLAFFGNIVILHVRNIFDFVLKTKKKYI